MRLYCDPISTVSRPVTLFMAEHGVEAEHVHVDLMTDENLGPAYLAINPNATVPYLVDGDFELGEATAILIYLADKVGSPTYPADREARAQVNAALSWFNSNFQQYYCMFGIYPRFGIPKGLDPAIAEGLLAYGATAAPRWLRVLDQHMLGERPYVCGVDVTLADYLGSAFVTLGEAVEFDLGPYPNIQGWIARMKARPHWNTAYAGFNGFLTALRTQNGVAA